MALGKCEITQTRMGAQCVKCGISFDADELDELATYVCSRASIPARAAPLDALRRRFERHAVKEGLSLMIHNGEYATPATIAAWRAYQAGYSLPRY